MDRLWDAFADRSRPPGEEALERRPALDVSETANEVIVKAEVPGMEPKDIDISLSDEILTIRGEKKQEREDKEENYHLIERSYGRFSRSIQLPRDIQSENIRAVYKNGILKITLPKSQEAKKKEIKINIE